MAKIFGRKSSRRKKRRSPQRRVFSALFLAGTLVFAMALLISFVSQFISPHTIWFAPFLGIPYPYLFVTNVCILIFWLLQLHRYSWVSLCAVLLTMSSMVKYVQWPWGADPSHDGAARILSYNINYFARNDGGEGYSVDSVASLIRKDSFNIVCIQEFRVEENCFHVDEFEKKIAPLKCITASNDPAVKRRFGTAIFSDYPSLSFRELQTVPYLPIFGCTRIRLFDSIVCILNPSVSLRMLNDCCREMLCWMMPTR